MIKVTISYDMLEGMEQECQEFLVNRLAPGLAKQGFHMADVWYTVWGSSPQILSGGELETISDARRIFTSSEWRELADKLSSLAKNVKVKVVNVGE